MNGQNIYYEEEEIDGFYFMIKGLACFTLPKLSGMFYAIIDPEETITKKKRMETF